MKTMTTTDKNNYYQFCGQYQNSKIELNYFFETFSFNLFHEIVSVLTLDTPLTVTKIYSFLAPALLRLWP